MTLKRMLENWSDLRKNNYYDGEPYMWGMSIDLNKCIGCGACNTACYAENNIPTVGGKGSGTGHSMHWMRIERYWDEPDGKADVDIVEAGDYPERGAHFIPMMCQQCNSAPCEPVCPVAATYSTPDRLNAQVYNRCIGSRYCSNNCPFKVRYFNFFDFWKDLEHPMEMQLNPDVTVREMGGMEKCTFCIQRIRGAQNEASNQGHADHVEDGTLQTACQQSCPTSAIVFGNLEDPESEVSKLWEEHQVKLNRSKQDKDRDVRGYRVFEGLNVEPSVMYVDRVRNTEA